MTNEQNQGLGIQGLTSMQVRQVQKTVFGVVDGLGR